MQRRIYSFKYFGALFVLFFGASLMFISSYVNGPDIKLQFVREVPSEFSSDWINRHIADPLRWPEWFYSLKKAEIINSSEAKRGAIVRLLIDPKKLKWKQFELTLRVTDYIPNRMIKLSLIDDSSHRLTQLFKSLEWTIELLPITNENRQNFTQSMNSNQKTGPGLGTGPILRNMNQTLPSSSVTMLRGTATAETKSWRARLFGRFAERIVMNQVFYPNLMKLAKMKEPSSAELDLMSTGSGH